MSLTTSSPSRRSIGTSTISIGAKRLPAGQRATLQHCSNPDTTRAEYVGVRALRTGAGRSCGRTVDPDDVTVTLRDDNGTQFTADRYRDDARAFGITLSRTAYRHPVGNAFIERLYRTLKERVRRAERLRLVRRCPRCDRGVWVIDYNHHRPDGSLGRDTVPAEARQRALHQHPAA